MDTLLLILTRCFSADPYGVLGPGEVHVKSSKRNLPDQGGRLTDLIKGDVLVGFVFSGLEFVGDADLSQVTRHPCKVPSDVQKVSQRFS